MTEDRGLKENIAELGERLRDGASDVGFHDVVLALAQHIENEEDALATEALKYLAPVQLALSRAAATRVETLDFVLRSMPSAAVAVSESGAILAANEAGSMLFDGSGGAPALNLTRDEMPSFVARCRSRPDRPAILMTRGTDGVLLAGHWRPEHAACILTIARWDWPRGLAEELASVCGLTPSECDVLACVMNGDTAEAIAARRGRSAGTVRQQTKSILSKLRVSSQAQAIASVAGLAVSWRQLGRGDEPAKSCALEVTHDAISVGRRTVGFRQFGLTDGIPVVQIHGALFGIGEHEAERAAAHAAGVSVLAVEKPGYGRTKPSTTADMVDAIVNDVLAVMDARRMRRAVVIAHDAGTVAAFRLAERAPQRVCALVAAPATPPMLGWEQTSDMPRSLRIHAWVAQRAPKLLDLFITLGMAHVNRQGSAILPELFFGGCDFDKALWMRPEYKGSFDAVYRFIAAQNGRGFRQDMIVTNLNWTARARAVNKPVTLMHGDMSQTVSRKALQSFAAGLPKAELVLVPEAGHTLPLSHPELIFSTAARMWKLHNAG